MTLAMLIASLVAAAIQTIPGIPSAVSTAISAVSGVIGVIQKNGLTSGAPVSVTVILATLQGVITELKTIPGLNQTVLADIQILENALAAALAADAAASQKVDPSQLSPIAPVS